jgi:hypothetical protein
LVRPEILDPTAYIWTVSV